MKLLLLLLLFVYIQCPEKNEKTVSKQISGFQLITELLFPSVKPSFMDSGFVIKKTGKVKAPQATETSDLTPAPVIEVLPGHKTPQATETSDFTPVPVVSQIETPQATETSDLTPAITLEAETPQATETSDFTPALDEASHSVTSSKLQTYLSVKNYMGHYYLL